MRTIRLLDTDILTPQHRYPASLILNPETGEIVSGICGQKVTGRTREAVLDQLQTIADHVDAVDYRPFYEVQPDGAHGFKLLAGCYSVDEQGRPSTVRYGACDSAFRLTSLQPAVRYRPSAGSFFLPDVSPDEIKRLWKHVTGLIKRAARAQAAIDTFQQALLAKRDANMRIDYAAVQLPPA